jgi:hypothetical protein|nr:MAG TPA: hypothetical protein [Crassvirales sp.]
MIPKKILVDLTEYELTILIWCLEECGRAYTESADTLQTKLRNLRSVVQTQPNLEE